MIERRVRRLVIAARVVAFENQGPEALRELDQASEAFAEDVSWEDATSVPNGYGETP